MDDENPRSSRDSFARILPVTMLLAVIFACAVSVQKVRDVTELAPPPDLRIVARSSTSVRIVWQASPHEGRQDFAGYNVYFANRSLIFAPLKDLPEPVLLGKIHEYEIDSRARPTFVHVRSRNTHGEISLPSLPEIEIRNDLPGQQNQ